MKFSSACCLGLAGMWLLAGACTGPPKVEQPSLSEDADVDALYRRGRAHYQLGEYRLAYESMIEAAERGHPKARLYLGRMYSLGQGVRKDTAKAAEWYLGHTNRTGRTSRPAWGASVDAEGYGRLHTAAEWGRVGDARQLLESGKVDVDAGIPDGRTALHMASQGGYRELVKLLLQHHADVDLAEDNGSAALHFAAIPGRAAIVNLLLEAQADPNLKNRHGETPLHMALHGYRQFGESRLRTGAPRVNPPKGVPPVGTPGDYVVVVSQLLAAGADVNEASDNQVTPLHRAAELAHPDLAELLIEHGANVRARNGLNQTPLHLAAGEGSTQVMSLLIREGADVNATGHHSSTPLLMAVAAGQTPAIGLLIEHKADLEHRDRVGHTAMHIAALIGDAATLHFLAQAGADINSRDTGGATPLHYAAAIGNPANVSQLIADGADVSAQAKNGSTALITTFPTDEEAKQLKTAAERVAKISREQGQSGEPPTADRDAVAELLIAAGANVNVAVPSGLTPLHNAAVLGLVPSVRAILQAGGDPMARDRSGFTALHYACDRGQVGVVKLLLEETSIPVDERENWNATPLHLTAQSGYYSPSQMAAVAELLLSHGADVHARMRGDQTPLHRAAERGKTRVASVLLKHGADTRARNHQNATPAQVARTFGHADLARALAPRGPLSEP